MRRGTRGRTGARARPATGSRSATRPGPRTVIAVSPTRSRPADRDSEPPTSTEPTGRRPEELRPRRPNLASRAARRPETECSDEAPRISSNRRPRSRPGNRGRRVSGPFAEARNHGFPNRGPFRRSAWIPVDFSGLGPLSDSSEPWRSHGARRSRLYACSRPPRPRTRTVNHDAPDRDHVARDGPDRRRSPVPMLRPQTGGVVRPPAIDPQIRPFDLPQTSCSGRHSVRSISVAARKRFPARFDRSSRLGSPTTGPWCNGSTLGFDPSSPSSNLGGPASFLACGVGLLKTDSSEFT